MNLIEKMFGTHSERELKMIYPIVDKIEALRPEMMKLSDEELRDKTRIYKERLAAGETLDDLLPEAFATVREAARRTLNMEHYPVQLIGGIVLHQGRIAAVSYTHLSIMVRRFSSIRAAGPDTLTASWAGAPGVLMMGTAMEQTPVSYSWSFTA